MVIQGLAFILRRCQIKLFAFAILLVSTGHLNAQSAVGSIDFYGSAKVNRDSLLNHLPLREGEPLRLSKVEIEKKILSVPGVRQVEVSQVCCVANKTSVFIGVFSEERSKSRLASNYTVDIRCPDTVTKLVQAYFSSLQNAILRGNAEDDLSQGHSLMIDSATRSVQLKFVGVANKYFDVLTRVLLTSSDAEQRANAATVIAYANYKQQLISIYRKAIKDPSPEVRNNVIRALSGFATYAQANPGKLNVDPAIVIPLLNSVYWLDRDKAMFFLVPFTQDRDKKTLAAIRKQALSSLMEMSHWTSEGYSYMAYILLGRIADVKEDEIHNSWQSKNRTLVFEAAKKLTAIR